MTITEFILQRVAEDEAFIRGEQCDFAGGPYQEDHMLADCAAKRRIVALHDDTDPMCVGCETPSPCPTLCALAAVYSDHTDHRDEWRP